MVWVGQLAHVGLADAQPAGELHLGDALGPHGRVEGELGGYDCRHRHQHLTVNRLARSGEGGVMSRPRWLRWTT